jgi:hypothetical protein
VPDPYGLAETVNGSLQVHSSILGASVGQKSQNSFGIHRPLVSFCCYERVVNRAERRRHLGATMTFRRGTVPPFSSADEAAGRPRRKETA